MTDEKESAEDLDKRLRVEMPMYEEAEIDPVRVHIYATAILAEELEAIKTAP
jgi:hypothetical protein